MNLKLLKNKNLSLLLLGRFVSMFGSGVMQFAFSLYVLRLTGSASQFASVLVVAMIPMLLLGPISGVFVDWFDRKKLIVYLDLISGLIVGVMFLISVTSTITMFHIYITVICLSIITTLFNPAINTAIPSLVDKDDLLEANSLNRVIMTITMMISPMVGGALFGIFGISIILLLNFVSFILSAISEAFIDLKTPNKKHNDFSFNSFYNDLKSGINFILNHNIMKKIITLSFVANAFFSPALSIGLIYIASMVIEVSDLQLGILQSSLMVGSLLGLSITGTVAKKIKLTKVIYMALIIMGTLVCLIGFSSLPAYLNLFNNNLIPYLTIVVLALIIGSAAVITNVGMATLMQKEVPSDMLGRVSSVKETASLCATPFGQIIFAGMYDTIGTFIPIMISGTVMVISAVLFNYSVHKTPKEAGASGSGF
ncbi:MFS transporter [Proteinivorax tanatarense]|uniref:MFS transporter n=1 Tax=Proteinivorax tanatarense TaxID=1260629 RepID=A0AAU7VK48_9FIRM